MFSKKFILFSVIGVVNTFNTALFSTIYAKWIQDNISSTLGYLTALCIAYLLNTTITFKRKISFDAFIRFLLSYIPNFLIYTVVSFFTINLFHWPQFIATALAAIIGVPVTFLLMKVFTFRDK